jgi:alkylation response protein AidB-like acyl-CoA dehydrogenase
MSDGKIFKGGEFLVTDATSSEIFTPEDLSDEQKQIAETTSQYLANDVMPRIDEIEQQRFEVSTQLMRKAGELGLLMVDALEDCDRLGLGKTTTALVADRIGPAGSFAVVFAAHSGLGVLPLLCYGTEEQKARYLEKLISGECIGAFCLTEPEAGSDALQPKSRAELTGDGKHYVLNGVKQFITNARLAGLFTIFAMVDGERVTAFLVERESDGLTLGPEEKKLGIKGTSTAQVILANVQVSVQNVLGEVGQGVHIAMNILNVGRLKLAAATTGAAKDDLAWGLRYANERKQFGRKIGAFGAIKEKIADATARIFAAESLVYRIGGLFDDRLGALDHSSGDFAKAYRKGLAEYAIECAIAKVFASEALAWVADEVLEIHGGYGYTADYPAERVYRDERINRIFEGTNEINRLTITGLVLKKAVKGDLPIQKAAAGAFDALMTPSFEELDESVPFVKERALLANLKTLFLVIAGAAAQKFGEKLAEEEEILMAAADLAIEIFALESAILRAEKAYPAASQRNKALLRAVAAICGFNGAERAGHAGRKAAFYVEEGDTLLMLLSGARRYSKFDASGLLDAKRRIAEASEEIERYVF